MTAAVETSRLTKYYGRVRGVVDLDLRIDEGEIFGFLGPNGAGKTTTIRLLLDLIHPTRGRATALGLDTRREGVRLRRSIGYVPGELALYERLSGEENLRYFARLRGGVDWTWVRELAERLDCDLSRRVSSLSTGNRHKVAILQAFMARPALLILDEPTTGLDPLMQHVFYELLHEANKAGQTVLLSSHLLPEVQAVCDRAAFVRDGRLIAVEDMAGRSLAAVRHVEAVFGGGEAMAGAAAPAADPAAAAAHLAALPGVDDVALDGRRLSFTVSGRIDAVLKELARHDVSALTSAEPDLEDVFMAYYGREETTDEG